MIVISTYRKPINKNKITILTVVLVTTEGDLDCRVIFSSIHLKNKYLEIYCTCPKGAIHLSLREEQQLFESQTAHIRPAANKAQNVRGKLLSSN